MSSMPVNSRPTLPHCFSRASDIYVSTAESSRKMRLITEDVHWSGVADSDERRRIQNRVNQRAARQRKLEKDREAGIERRARGRPKGTTKKSTPSSASPESVAVAGPFRICEVNSATVTTFIDQLLTTVNNGLKTGHPQSDLLLSLTQFNTFRAMMQNISSLGLTLEVMKNEESISAFNKTAQIGNLPPSLQPTALQSTMPHHPWIDPFPIPSFRDALLLQEGAYDEDAFCGDLLGECGSPGGQVGIIVWGDHPFDPMGYEMTEGFAKKWAWLLQGCWELKASTDYWRRSRGERPIFDVEELE